MSAAAAMRRHMGSASRRLLADFDAATSVEGDTD